MSSCLSPLPRTWVSMVSILCRTLHLHCKPFPLLFYQYPAQIGSFCMFKLQKKKKNMTRMYLKSGHLNYEVSE